MGNIILKNKLSIFLIIIFCLGFVAVILNFYYNAIIFVENASPNDERVDITVSCENEILVKDTFVNSLITPNYKMFFAHVPRGKRLIKVKSNDLNVEKSQHFLFSWERTYIIVEYQNWQIDVPDNEETDASKTKKILDVKQLLLGISTKDLNFNEV